MMRKYLYGIAILAASTASTLAQVPVSISMGQIQTLNAALNAIDNGSPEQCTTKPKADAKQSSPDVCPYNKSVDLILAMAHDMLVLQGPLTQFQTEQGAVLKEVRAKYKLSPDSNEQQSRNINQLQNGEYQAKMQPLLDAKVQIIDLVPITRDMLNIGDPPDHNRLSAATLVALQPVAPWVGRR